MGAPAFALTADGKDRTATISDRLMSLTVVDSSGHDSDTLELVLDDRDAAIATPRKGAVLGVMIGYAGQALVDKGLYLVDEVTVEGPPDTMTIRAKAADMRDSLKTPKTRAWRDQTLGAIVETIAGEHGLKSAVAADLASQQVSHRDQTAESDLHFLTRLAKDYGAVASPKGGKLVFTAAGKAASASGQALAKTTFERSDLSKWSATLADREHHGAVKARWRDHKAATTKDETAGSGTPSRTLRHVYASQAAAQAAAKAALERGFRKAQKVSVTPCEGLPAMAAQAPFSVAGVRTGVDGDWIAHEVTHTLDFRGEGFTTQIEGTVDGQTDPEADPEAPDGQEPDA